MTENGVGLREQKKLATRVALREAALRLALEVGPDNVRVSDIAKAAGVSLRTYNNYFPSREHAIVAGITAEREQRIANAILAQLEQASLSEAVIAAVVEQYTDTGQYAQDALFLITKSLALRKIYAESVGVSEQSLADALIERAPGISPLPARVLAVSIGAAAQLAIKTWLGTASITSSSSGIVVPTGSLADHIRAALIPLAPALDAATDIAS